MPVGTSKAPRRLRTYTNEQKAEALAALSLNDGSVHGLAQDLGIPPKTLENWKNGIGINQDVANVAYIKKTEIRDLHKLIVIKSLGLLQTKLDDCSGQQLSTIAGISTDKMQLLDGEPTSINESRLVDEEARKAKLNGLFADVNSALDPDEIVH